MQAAVLRVKLRRLAPLIEERRRLAARYSTALAGTVETPSILPGAQHSFHLYPIRVKRRDELAEHLADRGVGTGVHYRAPLHRQPAYAAVSVFGELPESDRAAAELLSLPLFPGLSEADQDRVIKAIASFADDDAG